MMQFIDLLCFFSSNCNNCNWHDFQQWITRSFTIRPVSLLLCNKRIILNGFRAINRLIEMNQAINIDALELKGQRNYYFRTKSIHFIGIHWFISQCYKFHYFQLVIFCIIKCQSKHFHFVYTFILEFPTCTDSKLLYKLIHILQYEN